MILAIDPGNTESAYVLYDRDTRTPVEFGKVLNEVLLEKLDELGGHAEKMIIEMIACYGMPVGKSVFETCVWIGRFIQEWKGEHELMFRRSVKMHLCNSVKAKDGNVRQAIIDRYLPTGGGKVPQLGTKKEPGPLYGMAKDVWAAMGVAITYSNH